MSLGKVSILVNCLNSEKYLRDALDSIYSQTYQDFEVILVDNCSTDNTANICQEYDHRLVYVKTEKTIPLYSARNVGLPKITGDYFCVLDSDDLWSRNKLRQQVQVLHDQGADFVFSDYSILWEEASKLKKAAYRVFKALDFSKLSGGNVSLIDLINPYPICLQTVMIKTEPLKGELFRDKLDHVGDMEFFLRLIKKHNLSVHYDPSPLAKIRYHSGQLSHASKRKWLKEFLYIYLFQLGPLFNQREKKKLRSRIDLARYEYYLSIGERRKALKKLSSHKLENLEYFYHYMRTLLRLEKRYE